MGMVTIIYGNQVEKMVRRIIRETGALDKVHPHDKILIKPNLVVSRRDWIGVDTDPRVVEALVNELKDRGISRITIGDGSGMGNSAGRAFEICGYTDMASRYGLELVDLERDRFIKMAVPMDGPFKELEIARTALECDFLINVPVMKAHMAALITCSLKNLKGVMPRRMKSAFHGVDLNKAIAQLNSVLSPDLILVDGLQGNLSSETGRTPVAMERILLGTNSVEVDSVVADFLGYPPRAIRYIGHSADAGLGSCDLDKINVRALNHPKRDVRFSPPPHFSKRFPCRIIAEGACCTCMGNLIFALERLHEQELLSRRLCFITGQKGEITSSGGETRISIGHCAAERSPEDLHLDECPPSAGAIYRFVASAITDE